MISNESATADLRQDLSAGANGVVSLSSGQCVSGSGEVDFVPILRALQAVGYEGYLSVEVFDYRLGAETITRARVSSILRRFGKRF